MESIIGLTQRLIGLSLCSAPARHKSGGQTGAQRLQSRLGAKIKRR